MITDTERRRLETQLRDMESMVHVLSMRLERTMTALALSLDAQAATQQRLDGQWDADPRVRTAVADLQAAAELYRHLLQSLFTHAPPGWPHFP